MAPNLSINRGVWAIRGLSYALPMATVQTSPATELPWPTPSGEASRAQMSVSARVPELLAPAGDWDCARAAVENGADAIYFGLEKFNARIRAHNFTQADLPKLMDFLH